MIWDHENYASYVRCKFYANMLFIILAVNIGIESLFSVEGHLVSKKRSSLGVKNVPKILFLNSILKSGIKVPKLKELLQLYPDL